MLEVALSEYKMSEFTDYYADGGVLCWKNDQLQPLAYSSRRLIKSRSRMKYTQLATKGSILEKL